MFLIQLYILGTGTFGRVCLCRDKTNDQFRAMKILAMADVIRLKQVEHVKNEKSILQEIDHPFVVNMWVNLVHLRFVKINDENTCNDVFFVKYFLLSTLKKIYKNKMFKPIFLFVINCIRRRIRHMTLKNFFYNNRHCQREKSLFHSYNVLKYDFIEKTSWIMEFLFNKMKLLFYLCQKF